MKTKIIFVDVDDTLVRTIGSKRIPMPASIAHVKQLFLEGYELYLWSSGGAQYAEDSALELGIHGCFKGFLPKPKQYIDDQAFSDWRYLQHVHPNSL
jgi:cation transport ATPase